MLEWEQQQLSSIYIQVHISHHFFLFTNADTAEKCAYSNQSNASCLNEYFLNTHDTTAGNKGGVYRVETMAGCDSPRSVCASVSLGESGYVSRRLDCRFSGTKRERVCFAPWHVVSIIRFNYLTSIFYVTSISLRRSTDFDVTITQVSSQKSLKNDVRKLCKDI